jgi:lysozyme
VNVEGERFVAYLCSAGHWTIGVGHTGLDVHQGLQIDKVTSRALLARDVSWAARVVDQQVHVPLSDNQRFALISFVFNMGEPAFVTSTLLHLLNTGDYASVPTQLLRWNKEHVNGVLRENAGLWSKGTASPNATL